jgi:hypothetical protein
VEGLSMKLPPIHTHDGRRAWAFLAIMGGAMVFSLFTWVALWLLQDKPDSVLSLAFAAHGQVFVGMTALGFAMGRRLQASVTREGLTINDSTIDVHNGDGT